MISSTLLAFGEGILGECKNYCLLIFEVEEQAEVIALVAVVEMLVVS